MIPRAHIIEWRSSAPWISDAQVEQDLIICRALVALYSHGVLKDSLAFRGGTALHKLYLAPATRYSEDIDMVQIDADAKQNRWQTGLSVESNSPSQRFSWGRWT